MYTIEWARLFSRTAANDRQSTIETRSESKSRYRVAAIVWYLGLTSFFTDVSSEMVSSVLPIYLVSYLHLTPIAFGTIDGLYQGFAAIARVGGGYFADRWRSHKAVASVGYVLSAVCKIALLSAGNAWSLVAATIAVDRTGKGIRTAPRDALISLSTPSKDLGYAFGVHRSLDAAGAVLGPLVAFAIFWYLPGNFEAIFLLSFCIASVGVGIILFFVNAPSSTYASENEAVSLRGAAALLGIQSFSRLSVAGAILSIATISDSFIFLTLQQQSDFGIAYFPLLYVGVAGFNSLCAVPFGRLADRHGRWRTFLIGHVLLLCVYGILLTPTGPGRLLATVVLLGGYYAATDGVLTAMASATLPPAFVGSGLAVLVTITNASRLFASVLFGALWQWFGMGSGITVFATALALGICIVALTRRG
jgi:MFS family permease